MYCPNCQAERPTGARYCPHCGTSVIETGRLYLEQTVEKIEAGGTAVGAVQSAGGHTHIGGTEVYTQAAPPPAQALHQLPSPPADFTGREVELAELEAAIAGVTGAGACISGMGGVGKTALALVLAQRLLARYPDAQFTLDLRGAGPQPVTPAQAMAHVVRAYQPAARLPAPQTSAAQGEVELAGLYRSCLYGQRALLLLDNAADRAQVEPLIPPPGCTLIVTSRQHLTLPGLRPLNLEALPPEDAVELLCKIAPRLKPPLPTELARLCGYLPLALRLAASALAERENLRLDRYLERLRDAQARLELVDASLSLSYNLLTAELQARWRALALFPATFDLAAAAAVWDTGPDAAEEALGELLRYSMVEWDPAAERYGLHDLARVYAAARLDTEERFEAGWRHAAHYERVLRAASDLYQQGGEALSRALARFDRERPNVEAGQRWAAEHAGQDPRATQLCANYPITGWTYLDNRLPFQAQIGWLEPAVAASKRLKDPHAEFRHLNSLGLAYRNLGQMESALQCYRRALWISRQSGDRGREAHILSNLGAAHCQSGQPQRGLKPIQQGLEIARSIKDRGLEALALGHLGVAYRALGQVQEAIACYQQALAIDREIGNRQHERWSLVYLGGAHHALGQIELAVDDYRQALAIDRERGNRRQERWSLVYLGRAYLALGQGELAIDHHRRALAIDLETGNRQGERALLSTLAHIDLDLGHQPQAIALYGQALAIDRESGDRKSEMRVLGNLGFAYRELGQAAQGVTHYQQALDIARETGDTGYEAHLLSNLGAAHCELEQIERGMGYIEQALALTRETGDRRREALALGHAGRAYRDLGRIEEAIGFYECALAIDREVGHRRVEAIHAWHLGELYEDTDPARAVALMEGWVAYAREIGRPDAQANAERVAEIRRRVAAQI